MLLIIYINYYIYMYINIIISIYIYYTIYICFIKILLLPYPHTKKTIE